MLNHNISEIYFYFQKVYLIILSRRAIIFDYIAWETSSQTLQFSTRLIGLLSTTLTSSQYSRMIPKSRFHWAASSSFQLRACLSIDNWRNCTIITQYWWKMGLRKSHCLCSVCVGHRYAGSMSCQGSQLYADNLSLTAISAPFPSFLNDSTNPMFATTSIPSISTAWELWPIPKFSISSRRSAPIAFLSAATMSFSSSLSRWGIGQAQVIPQESWQYYASVIDKNTLFPKGSNSSYNGKVSKSSSSKIYWTSSNASPQMDSLLHQDYNNAHNASSSTSVRKKKKLNTWAKWQKDCRDHSETWWLSESTPKMHLWNEWQSSTMPSLWSAVMPSKCGAAWSCCRG